MRLVIAALVVAAITGACAHAPMVAEDGYLVTSDSSQYSPVVRLRYRPTAADHDVRIDIEGGSLAVPGGAAAPGAPPLMSQLYLTVIVGTVDEANGDLRARGAAGDAGHGPVRQWRAVATSDSVLVADSIGYGGSHVMRPMQFRVALPDSVDITQLALWPVFRVSGNMVVIRAPATPGGQPIRLAARGGVEVFACGERDILGRPNASRAIALRTAYGLAC